MLIHVYFGAFFDDSTIFERRDCHEYFNCVQTFENSYIVNQCRPQNLTIREGVLKYEFRYSDISCYCFLKIYTWCVRSGESSVNNSVKQKQFRLEYNENELSLNLMQYKTINYVKNPRNACKKFI